MEKVECKCGKASMTYDIIGEDLWSAVPENTSIVKEKYTKVCICKSCGTKYDEYDPCMVKLFKPLKLNTEIR